jgi:hypothetical protein
MKRPKRKKPKGFKKPNYYTEDVKTRRMINNARRYVLTFEVDEDLYKRFQTYLYKRGNHHGLQSAILREALDVYLEYHESTEKENSDENN